MMNTKSEVITRTIIVIWTLLSVLLSAYLLLLAGQTTDPALASTSPVSPMSTPSGISANDPIPCQLMPLDSIWYARIDALPTMPAGPTYVAEIGVNKYLHTAFASGTYQEAGRTLGVGIPYNVVGTATSLVTVTPDQSASQSDFGLAPIPTYAIIEGATIQTPVPDYGDRHVSIVRSGDCSLWEMFSSRPQSASNPRWLAGSTAKWDMNSNAMRMIPWTSAAADGMPMLPGIIRYDELVNATDALTHAIRMTAPRAAINSVNYVWPASHTDGRGGTGSNKVPMGTCFRLKSNVNLDGFSITNTKILRTLQRYCIFVADSDDAWHISGAPDRHWDDNELSALNTIVGSNFEAVDISGLMINPTSYQAATLTPTPTYTFTPTPTRTFTPTPTYTFTYTPTATFTPTPTPCGGAYHYLTPQPSGGNNTASPSNGDTVNVGDHFTLELWIDSRQYAVDAQQTYITFTSAYLENVAVAQSGCVLASTVTADLTTFDEAAPQNQVCNGPPDTCTFNSLPVPRGSIAFASHVSANPTPAPYSAFRVAQIAFCARAPGQATLRFQFTPTDPDNRNTQIIEGLTTPVNQPSCYIEYVINVVGPAWTPTLTSTPANTSTYTSTPVFTFTPTDTPTYTFTPTPTPNTGIINGHLTWQGISQPNSHNAGMTATLTLSNIPITTDSSGNFSVYTGLGNGTYSWQIKRVTHLANIGTLTMSGGSATQEFGAQNAGDCTNDNLVSGSDFNILKNTFGKRVCSSPDPGYDARADFTNDCVVNIADFNLQKSNFGTAGATFTCP